MSNVQKVASKIKIIIRSPGFWFISGGYLLRLFFMPITGQHDVMFMPWMAHYINLGHFNLYAFLFEKYGDIVMIRPAVWAAYPYGFFGYTAGWLEILEKLGLLNLSNWDAVWGVPYPARSVFLFKAAYLPFDFLIGYILMRTAGRLGLALWAWSAAALYTPFMMGQNDIYATGLAVAAIYSGTRAIQVSMVGEVHGPTPWPNKRAILACVLLGLGATFKIYPLLFLIPLVLVMEREWRHRLFLALIGVSTFGISVIPFIKTPTFIHGVLYNPEGIKMFGGIQVLGVSISPFLISYLILLFILLFRNPKQAQPHRTWHAGLATLGILFLWTPFPFYWLIWITPFIIGSIEKSPRLFYAWLLLQISFVFLLFTSHRELGIALPIHLSDYFNVPNIPTILALDHPALFGFYGNFFVPLSNVLSIAAILLLLWYSIQYLTKNNVASGPVAYNFRSRLIIGLPIILMILGLVGNLFLSRDRVSRPIWQAWQSQTLQAGDYAVQTLTSPEITTLTGIRLGLSNPVTPAKLHICIYPSADLSRRPLSCVEKNTNEYLENQMLYFMLDKQLPLEAGETLTAKISAIDAPVSLSFVSENSAENYLYIDHEHIYGGLDIALTSSFDLSNALHQLFVENIFMDRWLMISMIFTGIIVVIFLGRLMGSGPERVSDNREI